VGPCTDPHTFAVVGIGNGSCGACGGKIFTYNGGTCSGTGSGSPTCVSFTTTRTYLENYLSTPVGGMVEAACTVALVACLAAGTPSTICDCIYSECAEDCTYIGTFAGAAMVNACY
jgi:hypothetical protein